MLFKIEDRHLKEPRKQGKNTVAFCDFHDDKKTPNLVIYPNRNGFKCFVCGAKGNAFKYLQDTGQLPPIETTGKAGRPTVQVKISDVKQAHEKLLADKDMLKVLKDKRGWNLKIIKELKLGLKNHFITIPIYSKYKKLLNIRLYDPLHNKEKTTPKTMGWAAGYGTRVDLFPIEALEKDDIMLCEGEPDMILARQMGFNAATFTAGLKGIQDKHLNTLINKRVNLIFDIDDEGRKAAKRITKYLVHLTKQIKNVQLPIDEPSNGDLTDYFHQGYSASDLKKLIKDTKPHILSSQSRDRIAKMEPEKMHLVDAAMATNAAKKQQIQATVSGKDLVPYLIPKRIEISCLSGGRTRMCPMCGVNETETKELTINAYDPELLLIVGCAENQARMVYRRMADIPQKCSAWNCDVQEYQNVEDVLLIPDIDDDDMWRPYVSRRAFIVNCPIETNRSYNMIGWTTAHPLTHHVVHIIEKAEMSQSMLENFEVTDKIRNNLAIFIPGNEQSIIDKINEIHLDLSENITHIWERNDMLWLIDLAYHSVLQFIFQGNPVRRGWVEVLLLGDTRQGKSETLMTIMSHYQAGEIVSAENLSFAGLVGGIQQNGNRRMIAWGKMPLNDTRLLGIDEFSGMNRDEIARLSGVRSSGIAEITKIQTEKTRSRVRLIIMSNPVKSGLQNYAYGVYALSELIGQPEDIARFDLALTIASEEIKPEQINRKIRARVKHIYTSDKCAVRVRWAWSRKLEQIQFTDDAVDLILEGATGQAKKYHPSIPLVEPSEQRIKIARLSVATAIMVYSTLDDEIVIVDEVHVDAALKIMEYTYSKPSMGYDHYSDGRYRENEMIDEDKVKRCVLKLGASGIITLLDKPHLQFMDVEDLCKGFRAEAKTLLSILTRNNALRKPHNVYKKTPPFTRLLIKMKKEMDELGASYFDGTDEDDDDEEENGQRKIPF